MIRRPGNSLPQIHVPGPSVDVIGDDTWSTEAHEWVCCVAKSARYEQCAPMHFYLTLQGLFCLDCQMSHYLAPVLLHHVRHSPTILFFDYVSTSNIMSSTAGFTVIHSLCRSTNIYKPRITYESCSFGNACSEHSSHYILASIKVA